MINKWRLILSKPAPGAWNMALDEAILFATANKKTPPTLRLYDWQTATLSIGFAQPSTDVDMSALAKANWELVRRPTGGRAILHVDELTYALTAPQDDPLLSGSLLESYRKISQALLAGLAELKVTAVGNKTYLNETVGNNSNPVCFETPSNYEITANDKKLIGSAQARKYAGILQHGSLPIKGDITRITTVLRYPSNNDRVAAAEKLTLRAATLEELLGYPPDWDSVAQAIIAGFEREFGVTLHPGQPTDEERKMAEELVSTKYGAPAWTLRI